MLQSLYAQIALVLYLLVCVAALLWGGRTEKVGAGIVLFGVVTTLVVQDRRWIDVDFGLLVVDTVQTLAFIALAIVSARIWTVCAAGLMLVVVMVHLTTLFQVDVQIFPYITAFNALGYCVLIALIVGVIQSRSRPTATGDGPWA